jgi:hypothetical protein
MLEEATVPLAPPASGHEAPLAAPSPATTYPARALGVAAAWVLGALPAVTGLTRCPMAMFTHHACPGCGMTRAMRLLLHGEVGASLHMHAFALPIAATSGLIMLGTTWAAYRLGNPTALLDVPVGRFAARAFVAAQAVLFLYYLARAFGAFGGLPPV